MSAEGFVLVMFGLAIIAQGAAQLLSRRPQPPHTHCYHWMSTADSGRIVYQHCCQCGAVLATHVIGRWGDQPWRYADHGRYIAYTSEVDYRNKIA